MNDEQVEGLINAIGSIAEVLMVYYNALISNGAGKELAIALVKDFQKSLFNGQVGGAK